MSGDDTEELESSEEEDTPDEDEDDGEEYIGGDFNEEVSKLETFFRLLLFKNQFISAW